MRQDEIDRLRAVCYASMFACSAFVLGGWLASDLPLFRNVVFRETVGTTALFAAITGAAYRVRPWALRHASIPWLQAGLRVAPLLAELLMFRFWVPGAVTMADYLVLPVSLPLADGWLARSEQAIGLPHPATYAWFERHGTMRLLDLVYFSMEHQISAMTLYWLVVRRELGRLWEYSAIVASAGVVSPFWLWVFPAEGPWAFYAGHYVDPPAMPSYLLPLRELRAGTMTDFEHVYGFLNFPSFHVVFALCVLWSMRGEPRWIVIPLAVLEVLVVVSTLPIGWHYLGDVVGGVVWTALFVALVTAIRTRGRRPFAPTKSGGR